MHLQGISLPGLDRAALNAFLDADLEFRHLLLGWLQWNDEERLYNDFHVKSNL